MSDVSFDKHGAGGRFSVSPSFAGTTLSGGTKVIPWTPHGIGRRHDFFVGFTPPLKFIEVTTRLRRIWIRAMYMPKFHTLVSDCNR